MAETLREIQMNFAGHIRDPDHIARRPEIEDRRMAIYRDLFFNNVEGFLANSYPVIRKILGTARWRQLIRDFLVDYRAHTPLFPELPRELLQFLEHSKNASYPPFLLELAHYEWVELALTVAEGEFETTSADNQQLLEHMLIKSPLAWALSYNYPVHQIREDFQPTQAAAQPIHLVVYRQPDDSVKFMQLNGVATRLLQLIERGGNNGRDCLGEIATEMTIDADQQFMERGTALLQQLQQRSVIAAA